MLVRDCMTTDAKLIGENSTVREAAQIMRDNDCGFLPVGDNDRLHGVVTDRDIVVRGLVESSDPTSQTISEVMSRDVLYCYDDRDAIDAVHMMGELRVRRLPVVDREKNFIGVIAIGDIAEAARTDSKTETHVGAALEQISAAA